MDRAFAQSAAAVRSRLSQLVSVREFERGVRMRVVDKRRYQSDTMPLAALEERLEASVMTPLEREPLSGRSATPLKPLDLSIGVEYLGYYRTSSGSWGAKALLSLASDETDGNNVGFRANVDVDSLLGYRGRASPGRDDGRVLSGPSTAILDAIVQRVAGVVRSWSRTSSGAIRAVTSVGSVPTRIRNDSTVRLAVLDALREACVQAWGTQVEASTILADLADVSERTSSTTRGVVLSYQLLDEQTTLTDDGFIFVVVRSILVNPQIPTGRSR